MARNKQVAVLSGSLVIRLTDKQLASLLQQFLAYLDQLPKPLHTFGHWIKDA